ncbi:SDR family oxidoreductase [uncultured Prevotella sp.]|uniref:SDR family NAD(P)-dependent oxidoreductase n=1 Tax=uncultured Prevotella sp. TaxID=159272 RepID=UPI0027E3AD1D|nr:SDR family oxidoreductase [uncultured Prevotella sp.]
MNFIKRVVNRVNLNSRIGNFLRSHYASFRVTRPYIIKVDEHEELKGKVAIITGGSGAIGRACAFRLAAEGAKVYVCGSRPTSAQPIVDEITTACKNAVAIQLNVLDAKSIQKTFEKIAADNNGHIDILVNSAGGSARGKANNVVDQSVEVFDEILNINLRGAMICAKEAAKYMISNKYGRIINITSVIGLQGKAGYSEYAASKGGSIAFVKSLAQELGRYGITVNGVAPGIVQRGEVTMDAMERLGRTNWMGTYGKPEDISAVVNFLCKDEASFITGQNIAADGGRSLGLKEQ